jgi:predicted dehydrogenase
LHFSCGGIANLTASRCSFQNDRGMQIFGTEGFASINLAESKVTLVSVPGWLKQRKYDVLDTTPEQQAFIREQLFNKILPKSELKIPTTNAILSEQKDWISAIRNGDTPKITAEQGRQAVEIAQSVLDSLAAHRWSQKDPATTGPFSLVSQPQVGLSQLLTEKRKAA